MKTGNRQEAIGNKGKSTSKKVVQLALGGLLLALSFPAQAQQPKLPRIGVILPGGPLYEAIDGLKDGLKELGLEEGKQFALAIRDTKGDAKAAEEAARTFEREKVSLIYALATSATTAAKGATTNTPIVFGVGSDPVVGGLVDSFVKPGGRLTGVYYLVTDLTAKRLEILKEILPKLSRVVTFYDPGYRVAAEGAKSGREEAKRLGLKFIERHANSAEELQKALHAVKIGEADAYFFIPDPIVVAHAQLIIDTARAKKLATMFHEQSLVTKGALASYGQNYHQVGRASAKYVQQVLSGAHPRDLKVETVENIELAINLQTAKALGLTIPTQVLARANKVIK
ncbi:MAG TPA: ABC transporter substrate-binding protein [Candidatus Binatia bacterium]|jgi:putative ABC transport system substrate-binding protein|nr:ABC transporter substrate-binding protein [Candidatus Binatia bacterium]